MSVIGFDIGNESCVIAAAKRGGVDVLLNNESKRETPAVVSFGEKQRFLGSAGAAFATANPKSTVSQIKRLIGRLYKEVEKDLKLLPFATSEGPRGGILIELDYLKTKWTFTPVEILAMLFKHLKQLTEKNLDTSVVDCVIGIPSYFSDLQRRLYLDAAVLGGLKPLRLIHDGTAIALGYGMYKTDFSNSGPTVVMFVDIGHCDIQVTLASFEQGGMKILSHTFDQNLGGRDFDEVLFNHFAAQFNENYKIDINSNARASARLRASCEKLKKVLSANAEAPISIECLIGDTDVRGIITREEFEKLSSNLLERVIDPCSEAIKHSGLNIDQIHTIELVGSGSRIPAITRYLNSFFEKEPTRTLNASECVARGCALGCAMLSPSLVVRDYKVKDSFPYSIAIPTQRGEIMVFPKGSLFPDSSIMNHSRKIPFYVQVAYKKESNFPAGISDIVGHFGIGSDELRSADKVKVEFKMKLNNNGIIELESATIKEDKQSYGFNAFYYVLNPMPSTRMLNLPFTKNLDASTTNEELDAAKEKEKKLAAQDTKVEEIKDQRNTLESFVYDTRSKLLSSYKSFATDSEKDLITKNLQETEDWLYEDSDDESEEDYTGKLKDLKKLLEPVENRYVENAIAKAKKALEDCIAKYRSCANSLRADHKAKVKNVCNKAEQWLVNSVSKRHSPSKILLTDINNLTKLVESDCESIIRSKSLYSWLEVSMDSDQRDRTVESHQKDQTVPTKVTKEAKALETCIEKYRTRAETLPAGMKEKVYNVFRKAEGQYLNAVSQKHSSPKTLATHCIRIMSSIESECESIIRSKSSISRYEEPNQRDQAMNSEISKKKAAKALQTCIAEHRSLAESQPADTKEMVLNECNHAEAWLNRSYPNAVSTSITDVIEKFKSNCESIIRPNPSFPKHERSNQSEETMDSENARAEAITALQTCIAECRWNAESLSVDKKVMVLDECNNAEVWLKQLPPNAMTTDITEIIEKFKIYCESIIRSNPSFPWHEKSNLKDSTRDFENARTEATKALQTCIAYCRVHAQALIADKKDMVLNECNEAEVWLTGLSQKHSSPNDITLIHNARKHLESYFEHVVVSNSSFLWHEEPKDKDQRGQNMEMDDHPVDPNQGEQPMDINQNDQPMGSKQGDPFTGSQFHI